MPCGGNSLEKHSIFEFSFPMKNGVLSCCSVGDVRELFTSPETTMEAA